MNVRLNVGAGLKTWQSIQTIAWCTLWLGALGTMLIPGTTAAAESTAATRTTLTVSTSQPHARTQATFTAHVAAANEEATPTGVVTFRSETTDLGSAFLDREGNASLQTDNLVAGSHQIVAVYQGENAFVTSTSDAQKLHANVATVAGFTLAAAPTSLSTPAGGFVNTIVTVTPITASMRTSVSRARVCPLIPPARLRRSVFRHFAPPVSAALKPARRARASCRSRHWLRRPLLRCTLSQMECCATPSFCPL